MQTPLQLTFRNIARSDALAAHLEGRAARLDEIFDRIISCHVVIELAGHHHRTGDRYRFCINVGLPGHEIVVTHDADDHDPQSVYATADKAFDDAERQIAHWVTRERAPRHQARPTGL